MDRKAMGLKTEADLSFAECRGMGVWGFKA